MDGYTTDYINLITDNLRDRYDNGFPILKELIQTRMMQRRGTSFSPTMAASRMQRIHS